MPDYGRRCSQCKTAPRYINVNNIGALCQFCYDVWYEENVLPDLRRQQHEWREAMDESRSRASLRVCDESMAQLIKRGEIRKIIDVNLPEPQ